MIKKALSWLQVVALSILLHYVIIFANVKSITLSGKHATTRAPERIADEPSFIGDYRLFIGDYRIIRPSSIIKHVTTNLQNHLILSTKGEGSGSNVKSAEDSAQLDRSHYTLSGNNNPPSSGKSNS